MVICGELVGSNKREKSFHFIFILFLCSGFLGWVSWSICKRSSWSFKNNNQYRPRPTIFTVSEAVRSICGNSHEEEEEDRFHLSFPSFKPSYGLLMAIYRFHLLGYPGNWYKFWKFDHIIAIYWLHLGYKIDIITIYWLHLCSFWKDSNFHTFCFPRFWLVNFWDWFFKPVIL